ncbi:MAG: Gfo/Idh/MocA family oxidoreductase [Cyclobacteriaceae bacterium]
MKNFQSNTNRREFVKIATTTASIAAMGIPFDSWATNNKDVLKIGLVGCGGRGTGAANEALKSSKRVKLVAMGDVFEDKLRGAYENLKSSYSDQVNVPNSRKFIGFDSYEKVINKCDAVILATPPPFRPIHFEEAVKSDKHVFMEKPLFVDIPGYHKMISINELAKQKKLSVAVGLQLRFEAGYQEMVQKINDGIIGSIISLDVYYNVGAPIINPRLPGQTEMNYQVRNWRYFSWLWGGQLAGQTIHQIDIMNWLMNDYPVRVNGIGGRQSFRGPNQGNTYDHHYAEFEYPNQVKLHVQSNNINNTWRKSGFHIQGAKGYADDRYRIYDQTGKMIWRHRDREQTLGSSQICQSAFINSIFENSPINHAEYGIESTLTSIIGRMAIHSGKAITKEEALTSTKSILPKMFTWDAEMPDKPGPDGNYAIPIPGITEVI